MRHLPKRRLNLLVVGAAPGRRRPRAAVLRGPRQGFDVVPAEHLERGLERLAHSTFDAVLLDASALRSGLRGAVERVQAAAPRTPVVLLGPKRSRRGAGIARACGCAWAAYDASQDELLARIADGSASGTDALGLPRAEACLRDFLETATDFFWEADERLRITFVSERFHEVTGIEPEAIIGKTAAEFGNPGIDARRWRRHLASLETQAAFRDFVLPSRSPTRGSAWISLNGKPVFDEKGEFRGYRGTGTDVTERLRAQAQARSNEQRYRDLFRHAPIGIWEEDYSGVKRIVDALQAQGIRDLGGYLAENDEVLRRLAKAAVLCGVNDALTRLYRTDDEDELETLLTDPENWVRYKHYYVPELVAFASGQTRFVWEGDFNALDGSDITVRIMARIPHEHAQSWARVITTEEEITERRRAEDAAARVRQTLSDAIEHMPEGFALFGADDRLVLCNERYRALFPKTAERRVPGTGFVELLRASLEHDEFILPEGMTREETAQARIRTRRAGLPFEWRTSDGRWVEIRDNVTESGTRVSICVDLTERKRTEERLRESEERYRQLFENESNAVVVIDAESMRFEDANIAALRLYGYSKEEFLELKVAEISAELEETLASATRAEGGMTGPRVIPERLLRDKKGRVFPAEISTGTFRSGDRIKVIASIRDISERKRAEEALRASEARLRAIIEGNPDGVLVLNEKGEVDFINRAAEALLGRNETQLVGQRIGVVGSGEATELEVLRPDGGLVVCELRAVAAEWHGKPVQIVAVRDVTGRKQAEAAIENLARFHSENPNPVFRIAAGGAIVETNAASRELLACWEGWRQGALSEDWQARIAKILAEARSRQTEIECEGKAFRLNLVPVVEGGYVNAYGEDITEQKTVEQRLRQVQKMEAVGQLTGGVAHDFNNRLTVIMGNLELLHRQMPRDGAGDEKLRKLVEAAHDAADHGAKLTRQLLAFSRRQVLEPKIVNLGEQIRALPDMFGRLIRDDIDFRTSCEEDLWYVNTDPGQLQDALLNLTLNARDAMPDGGVLAVEARNAPLEPSDVKERPYVKAGDYVLLVVSDTGHGMSKDLRERAFEPFFTTKGDKGTGLGLSMVYGFVKQSSGFIEIESEPHRGTSIHIYLPRHRLEAEPAPRAAALPRERALEPSTATVLVVEDDDTVRKIAVAILRDIGYRVLEACRGSDALEVLVEQGPVDLLFTDVVMPGGMGAFELAEEAAKVSPGIKVLYTSGYSKEGPFGDEALARGVNWLNKPYDRRSLERKARAVLCGGEL